MNQSVVFIALLCVIAVSARPHSKKYGQAKSYVSRYDDTSIKTYHGYNSQQGGWNPSTNGWETGQSNDWNTQNVNQENHQDDHDKWHHHPSYTFEYGVKDPHTHDHHSQWEHRDGDTVHGEYTLDEADGTKRVVTYSADKLTGFHAHVQRIGHAKHDHGHHHQQSY